MKTNDDIGFIFTPLCFLLIVNNFSLSSQACNQIENKLLPDWISPQDWGRL